MPVILSPHTFTGLESEKIIFFHVPYNFLSFIESRTNFSSTSFVSEACTAQLLTSDYKLRRPVIFVANK
jgi:hypothetical protein